VKENVMWSLFFYYGIFGIEHLFERWIKKKASMVSFITKISKPS